MAINFDTSIIIPIYNEKNHLEELIKRVFETEHRFSYEVWVIDSGSDDGSSDEIRRLSGVYKFNSMRLEQNKGKGYAVRKGIERASGKIILIQDADLEYDPVDYNKLIHSIKIEKNDFVLGSRTLSFQSWRIRQVRGLNISLEVINVGSHLMTWIFCLLYSVQISDVHTMYKVFRKELIQDMTFKCEKFDFDLELLAKLILKGYIPKELPVKYQSRSAKEGKKLNYFKDGVQAFLVMFKVRVLHVLS